MTVVGSKSAAYRMMARHGNILSGCGVLLLLLCSGMARAGEEWIYVLQKGDNLWNITERYLKGMHYWRKLQRLNQVRQPLQMPPGSRIRIPLDWLKVQPAQARVNDSTDGNRYVPAGASAAIALSIGTLLEAGDNIRIAPQGSASIAFPDGSIVDLAGSTELQLQRVNRFSDTGIGDSQSLLRNGRGEVRVESKGTRFEIRTPSASTAVRGTDYRVSVDGNDNAHSRIEVIAGEVGVGGAGLTRELPAGFGTSVEQGKPPAPAVRLLPAPALQSPRYVDAGMRFAWEPVPGASAYRLQVRLNDATRRLVLDRVVPGPAHISDGLATGRYLLQVRAIDATGLEGLQAQWPFQRKPGLPVLLGPQDGQTVRSPVPRFAWSRPPGVSRFHVQVSSSARFADPIIDLRDYPGTVLVPTVLAPGRYHWRVAAREAGQTGEFGKAAVFGFRPLPEVTGITVSSDEFRIRIRWQPDVAGRRYGLQIATDKDFQRLLVNQVLETPEWQMPRADQKLYFRLRTLDSDEFAGPWSPVDSIAPPGIPWLYGLIPLSVFLLAIAL